MNAAPSVGFNVAAGTGADIFSSEAGLLKALATLRQAAMPPEEKNHLRNLILSYAGESEDEKRTQIKSEVIAALSKNPQLSATLGIVSETAKPALEIEQNLLGRTRPAPQFKPVTTKEQNRSSLLTPETAQAPVAETGNQPEPRDSDTETKTTPTTAPVKASKETTIENPEAEIAIAEAKIPKPATIKSGINAKAKIDAIKHDINSKVGNPVNLINADETIGREYMSALLSAMKQASIGGGGESMSRLDAAYQAALKLIEEKGLASNSSSVKEEVIKTSTESEAPLPIQSTPVPQAKATKSAPVPEPTPEIKPAPAPATQSEGLYHRPSDEVEASLSHDTEDKISSFASRFFTTPEPTEKAAPPKPDIKPEVAVVQKANVTPKATTPPPPNTLKPLKETATALPQKIADLKEAADKREQESKKPITDLKSPEIDSGLRQLLSEWILFKKSGFLGTGPSGIDHPLYKKLSGLPMAAVVSGRFEGVTPEIKRHISDYMTGWRYEQGITHEMGETFDNYLRRVIKQVLEKQRGLSTVKS